MFDICAISIALLSCFSRCRPERRVCIMILIAQILNYILPTMFDYGVGYCVAALIDFSVFFACTLIETEISIPVGAVNFISVLNNFSGFILFSENLSPDVYELIAASLMIIQCLVVLFYGKSTMDSIRYWCRMVRPVDN